MRVVFAAVGAYGHLLPLVPLALAVKDAGQDVVFATDERIHPVLHQAGLEPVHAGTGIWHAIAEVRAQAGGELRSDPSPQAFGSVLPRQTIADLAPVLADKRPDLVVYEVLDPGAGIAAAMAGIPAVCHGTIRISGGPSWKAMCETWTATAEEFGIEIPVVNPEFFGNTYIDPCPPSFQLPEFAASTERVLMRPTPWRQPVELPPFVRDRSTDRPLVYVSFGTLHGGPEEFRKVIHGLSALPVDVLVSGGRKVDPEDIGRDGLPSNVVIENWVPQGNVLPYVDLVVSHGGGVTVLETLAYGLPHLIIPQGPRVHSINGRLVTEAGIGGQLPPEQLTPESVATQVRDLLADQRVRARTREFAQEISGMPSPRETAEWLVGFPG